MERRKFLAVLAGGLTKATFGELIQTTTAHADEVSPLAAFLAELEPEKARISGIVKANDIFKGFKDSANERRMEDLNLYFPIYKAAEKTYGVPFGLLWTIHAHETDVSSYGNPGESGYVGAMQRSASLYPDVEVNKASQDWSFLSNLPQRYRKPRTYNDNPFSVDYQEILWAAQYICKQTELRYPQMSYGEALLEVVHWNYSAPSFGAQRVNQYLELAELFT